MNLITIVTKGADSQVMACLEVAEGNNAMSEKSGTATVCVGTAEVSVDLEALHPCQGLKPLHGMQEFVVEGYYVTDVFCKEMLFTIWSYNELLAKLAARFVCDHDEDMRPYATHGLHVILHPEDPALR